MSVDLLISRLHNVRQTGPGRWVAGCPLCQSRRGTPVKIRELPDGLVLLKAFCGCDTESVVGGLGLHLSDLFPGRIGHNVVPVRRPFDATQVLLAVAQEIGVVDLIAHDSEAAGRFDAQQRARLHVAAGRLDAALVALDMPIPPEIRAIRRAP